MKWPWEQFGFDLPSLGGLRDPELVLRLLQLEDLADSSVHFYDSLGRAVVVSSGTAPNEIVRKASRLLAWDIDVLTSVQFNQLQQAALRRFLSMQRVGSDLAESLVEHGYFSFDDLSVVDPSFLMLLGVPDAESAEAIIEEADFRGQQMDG
jgi:hypothetical protein